MAYYRFTAPEYDNALLAEGEFHSLAEVEEVVNYLAESHGCLVSSTRLTKISQTRSVLDTFRGKFAKNSDVWVSP